MFTFWWILLTFLAGGAAGVLLIALIRVAGDEVPRASPARELPAAPAQRSNEALALGLRR